VQDDQKVSDLPDHGSRNPYNFRQCKPPAQASAAAAAAARPGPARRRALQGHRHGLHHGQGHGRGHGLPQGALRGARVEPQGGRTLRTTKVVSYALGFHCHFRGTEALLKLNCRKGE
jgi:hypothetical protein